MRAFGAGAARALIRTIQLVRPVIGPFLRAIPGHYRASIRAGLFRRGWGSSASTDATSVRPDTLPGITLIGYPRAEFGMGESIRSMARAASSARIPVETYNFTLHVSARQRDLTLDNLLTAKPTRRTNVFCVNFDLLPETIQAIGQSYVFGKYNIARPFWELPLLPSSLANSINFVDEVWTASEFNQVAFSQLTERPVLKIPMAIALPSPASLPRSHFGISNDTFVFAFSFDFSSYASRKNPQAVVDAFKLAFPNPAEAGVTLMIKTMGDGPGRQDALARLKSAAQGDPRIHVVNQVWSREEVDSFLWMCDCYVSLHRSEGFGLGLAEAMARSKPVIATDYSGTTDFVNAATGYPVPFTLIEVEPGEYPHYQPGQYWAEPNIESASNHMRSIYHQRDDARSIGIAARDFILREHSPERVGQVISDRLKALGLLEPS
jgi:glycosyltransferase involved in cell wall biosynthesis